MRAFRLGVGQRQVERDVDQELSFHIEMRTARLVASGMDPVTARARAVARFGDPAAVRAAVLTIDQHRERAMRRSNYLADLRQDISYALRSLRQHAMFTTVIVLTLALGIGANTATFTLIDALILRTLPVPHPEQLVAIGDLHRVNSLSHSTSEIGDLFSYPLYVDVRAGSGKYVSGLAATGRTNRLDVVVDSGAAAEHPVGRTVSENYFSVYEVGAARGRTFSASEAAVAGDDPVVVISYNYWQRRFAGAPNTIGRTITVNHVPLTIVGVAARGFSGDVVGRAIDIWVPLMMQPVLTPTEPMLQAPDTRWLLFMGRTAPGVSVAQAGAGLAAMAGQLMAARSGAPAPTVFASPGAKGFSSARSQFGESLTTLMAAVGLVLLVVAANVATLLLGRAVARQREMAMRMALGAGRMRLVRQLLTESVLLAAAGGLLGLLLALAGSRVLIALAQIQFLDVTPDPRVLAFTAAVSLATALLFGLLPALRATGFDLATATRTRADSSGRRNGAGQMLVVLQVALSVMLLVCTGLLVRSLRRLDTADIGLAREELIIATIDASRSHIDSMTFLSSSRALVERVRTLPGVASVTLSENGIFSGTESSNTMLVDGFVPRQADDSSIYSDAIGPEYFRTVGAKVLEGRDLRADDNEHGAKVVVVNAAMAKYYFPGRDALGGTVRFDSLPWTIVGVVGDIKENSLKTAPVRRMYMPVYQMYRTGAPDYFSLEIRTKGNPAAMVNEVRRALLAADPSLDINEIQALQDLTRDSVRADRLMAQVVTFFGLLALALATLGLYGVMTHATARRTGEFGLRMALGAVPANVTNLVLRESLLLVAGGVVLGMPVAIAASRVLRHQLFGAGPLDPVSIGVSILMLTITAALAGYLPAARAARVSPLEALRVQ